MYIYLLFKIITISQNDPLKDRSKVICCIVVLNVIIILSRSWSRIYCDIVFFAECVLQNN